MTTEKYHIKPIHRNPKSHKLSLAKMSPTKLSSSLLIFLVSMVTIGYALDCSNIHYKESEGVLNYLANVTFTVPYTTSGWRFYFQFDRNFTGIGVSTFFVVMSTNNFDNTNPCYLVREGTFPKMTLIL